MEEPRIHLDRSPDARVRYWREHGRVASTRDVLNLTLRQSMQLVLVGVVLGTGMALLVSRLMSALLFGLSSTDPLTFAAVAVLLTSVALLSCYLPARRASKIDPLVALSQRH